jgi:MATE family multidrug resistance protein
LLIIAAIFQLSDAVQAIAAGALRGAGDTAATFWMNLLGHYGLGIWVALGLGFAAEWGAEGLWWGLSAGLTLVALALVLRFAMLTRKSIRAQV